MKKTVLATSIALASLYMTPVLAEEGNTQATESAEVQGTATTKEANQSKGQLVAVKEEVSTAELLTVTNQQEKEEGRLHGTIGSNIEIERVVNDRGVNEGKVKYTLAQGNFRHDDLPGWDFGFYSGREDLFTGNLKHADYNRGVNAIQEIYVNKAYGLERGSVGWGLKLASESIDKRTTPGGKVFGSYQLTDNLEVHGYGLYHVEYKRDQGEFPYWELEPGLGYKISDNSGAWLNFRYQVGEWKGKDGTRQTETEYIIKPGIWYSWGKLSASLWGEFGSFEKENDITGQHEWTEDYSKLGISANYPIAKNWRVFTEVSYKKIDYKEGAQKSEFEGYIPLFIAGINYSF